MSALTALEIRELTNFLKPFLEREYLDRVYPIGSLYFSATEVDPSALFGGTWERIKDKFLLASGNSYAVGSVGGSADAEVVRHNHYISNNRGDTIDMSRGYYVDGSVIKLSDSDFKGTWLPTDYTGEDGTGKNMPPYLAICVWKRTA